VRAETPAIAGTTERRFLDLVERNRGRVERLCRTYARSPADLDDLRSEVWLQLWRSLPSFDGQASEDTWLYRVALNTVLLHGRREGVRRRAAEALGREPSRSPVSVPAVGAERVDRRRRLERLHEALRRLDPADRALVTLYLEELPYRQIAEITGLTESNVGVRLHRIRERLRRWLDPDEPTMTSADGAGRGEADGDR
jgi:RNA polymerase sigma-70 factor (ECF subfamily)